MMCIAFLVTVLAYRAPDVGAAAPRFEVVRIGEQAEKRITLDEFRGQPLLLEFWATWCKPCENASKLLVKLHNSHSAHGLRIVAISSEPADTIRRHLLTHSVPYVVAADRDHSTHRSYDIHGFPSAVLIDAKGVVRWRGDPRELKIASIGEFLTTGKAPASNPEPDEQPSSNEPDRSLISLEIRPSNAKAESSTGFAFGEAADSDFTFSCTGKSAGSIVAALLRVSGSRLTVEPSLKEKLYDVKYFRRSVGSSEIDRQVLVSAVCNSAGACLDTLKETRTIWIAAKGRNSPRVPSGKGGFEAYMTEDGKYVARNSPIAFVFRSLEGRYGVIVEDTTGLDGRYDLSFAMGSSFRKTREEITRKYGMMFQKTIRDVEVFRLRSMKPQNTSGGN